MDVAAPVSSGEFVVGWTLVESSSSKPRVFLTDPTERTDQEATAARFVLDFR